MGVCRGTCTSVHYTAPCPSRISAPRSVPKTSGRKLVLATSIAETSLTIEDVRIVVDGGKARRARFDAGRGMSRLVTEDVSRAEADQRRGRAGRTAPGVCYRLWTRGQDGARPAFAPAEIEVADLAGLALELAQWGGDDGLRFLTLPPAKALDDARALLAALGALDAEGRITPHGQDLVRLPLHPRLGHLVRRGGTGSARLAALLSERDPMRGAGMGVDLIPRLRALDTTDPRADAGVVARIRDEARRLKRHEDGPDLGPGAQASLAYPDRIALRRDGEAPRYLLSGGAGAAIGDGDPLGRLRLIVVTDLDGDRREAHIRGALAITEGELRAVHGDRIAWRDICRWSARTSRVEARRQEMLDALILDDRRWDDPPPAAVAEALCAGIRALGLEALGWSRAARLLRARIRYAGVADMSDEALLDTLEHWAAPYLTGIRDAAGLSRFDPSEALRSLVGWPGMAEVDRLAPQHWTSPLGRNLAIDYGGEMPEISVRLQEVLGTTRHPTIGQDGLPIRLVLLSPANRRSR
jgi:ATP-dependent helicase HrpB